MRATQRNTIPRRRPVDVRARKVWKPKRQSIVNLCRGSHNVVSRSLCAPHLPEQRAVDGAGACRLCPWRPHVRGLMVPRGENREIFHTAQFSTGSPAEREEQGPGSAREQYRKEKERQGKAVQAVQRERTAVQTADDSDDSETKLSEKVFFFFGFWFSGHGGYLRLNAAQAQPRNN